MTNQLTHEAFANNLQTRFLAYVGPGQAVELELTQVSELKLSARQEQFAILFRGPSEAFLGQGTRLLTHELIGEFDLFLVPIRQDSEGFYYEAIFNRISEQEETAG